MGWRIVVLGCALVLSEATIHHSDAETGKVGGATFDDRIDAAIERGLDFLGTVQAVGPAPVVHGEGQAPAKPVSDGSISDSPAHTGSAGLTSLCTLAYLSKGHKPGEGRHGKTINAALDYVLLQQSDDGLIAGPDVRLQKNLTSTMYGHCISTLLLAEAARMVDPDRRARIDKSLPKAISLILAAQAVVKPKESSGGWRYLPDSKDSDLSVTVWAIMALRAAKVNGVDVPQKDFDAAAEFVLRCFKEQSRGFAYSPGGQARAGLTAAGIVCLELCGRDGHAAIAPAREFLLKNEPKQFIEDFDSIYAAYFCGLAALKSGDAHWQRWALQKYDHLLGVQRADGGWNETNHVHGRSYSTAFAILAMTPRDRKLSIYQQKKQ